MSGSFDRCPVLFQRRYQGEVVDIIGWDDGPKGKGPREFCLRLADKSIKFVPASETERIPPSWERRPPQAIQGDEQRKAKT